MKTRIIWGIALMVTGSFVITYVFVGDTEGISLYVKDHITAAGFVIFAVGLALVLFFKKKKVPESIKSEPENKKLPIFEPYNKNVKYEYHQEVDPVWVVVRAIFFIVALLISSALTYFFYFN